MKKIICILLIVFLVLPFASACNPEKDDNISNISANLTDDEGLGLEPRNFEGKTFNILTIEDDSGTKYYDREISTEEQTGEYINDAVYERTQQLKEKYGINLKVSFTPAPSKDYKNQIIAGDDTYDIIADAIISLAWLGKSNLLWDLNKVPNLNLENSWWDQSAVNDLSTAGYSFYLTGDAVVSDKNATWVCFFNRDMINDYHLEDPYELVKNNEWTIDKLHSMAKKVSTANQGLSEVTYENGTYGFLTQSYDAIASMASFNQKMIIKDENDYPKLDIKNEATSNRFNKVFDLITDKSTSLIAEKVASKWSSEVYDKTNSVFFEGRGLFQYNPLSYVQSILNANADFEYGLLPIPKYDENQEHYHSTCTTYFSMFLCIPISVKKENLDDIGYVLETLGYYGQKLVRPAYYDVTIKSQKMPDQESEDMLDIIFANRVFDLATVYDYMGALGIYTDIVLSGNNTLTSTIEARSSKIEAKIDEVVEEFKKINQ